MIESKEIKARIQALIDKAVSDNNKQKELLNALFRKLDQIKELEQIERMPPEFLKAYLTFKQAFYSNYQSELLEQARFKDTDHYLKRLSDEVELIEKSESRKREPDNYELIEILDNRRRDGEIELDCQHDKDGVWYTMKEKAEMSKEEADSLADQFLKKHGIKKDKDGTPDIIGKVMGDYQKTIKKTHNILSRGELLDTLDGVFKYYGGKVGQPTSYDMKIRQARVLIDEDKTDEKHKDTLRQALYELGELNDHDNN